MSETLDQNPLNLQSASDVSNNGSSRQAKVSTVPKISPIPEIPAVPARKTTGNANLDVSKSKGPPPAKPATNPVLAKVAPKQSPPNSLETSAATAPASSNYSPTATGQSLKNAKGVPPPVPPSRTNSKRTDIISLHSEKSFKRETSDQKIEPSAIPADVVMTKFKSSPPPARTPEIEKPVVSKKLSFNLSDKNHSKADSLGIDAPMVPQSVAMSTSPTEAYILDTDPALSKPLRMKSESSTSLAKTIAHKNQPSSKDLGNDKNTAQTLSGVKSELTRQMSSSNPALDNPRPNPFPKSESGSKLSSLFTPPPVLKSDSAPSVNHKSDPSTPNLKKSHDSLTVGAASKRSTTDLPTLRKTHSINLSNSIHTANTIRVKSIDTETLEKMQNYVDVIRPTNDDLILSPVEDPPPPKSMNRAITSYRNDSNAHQFTVIRKAGSQGSLSSVATQQAEIVSPFKKMNQSQSLESIPSFPMEDDYPMTPKEKKIPPVVPPRKVASVNKDSTGDSVATDRPKSNVISKDIKIDSGSSDRPKSNVVSKETKIDSAAVEQPKSNVISKDIKDDSMAAERPKSNIMTNQENPKANLDSKNVVLLKSDTVTQKDITKSNSSNSKSTDTLSNIITAYRTDFKPDSEPNTATEVHLVKSELSKSTSKLHNSLAPTSAAPSNSSISSPQAPLRKVASQLIPSPQSPHLHHKSVHPHLINQSFLIDQSFSVLASTTNRHHYKFHFDRIATSLMTHCLNQIQYSKPVVSPSDDPPKICLLTTNFASGTFIPSYTALTSGRICNITLSESSRNIRLTNDINVRFILLPMGILSLDIIPIINLLIIEYGVSLERIIVLAVVSTSGMIEEVLKKVKVKIVVGRIGEDIGEFPGRYFGYE